MPAVDPQRLTRDIQRLLDMLDEPQTFTNAALERLEFYADRAKRSGLADQVVGGERALHVRAPVLRALSQEFTRLGRERPEHCLQAADQLWEAGWRESRILAVSLLREIAKPTTASRVERWAEGTEDRTVLEAVAGDALAGLRRSSPGGFLRSVRGWLRAGRERPRLLALLALRAAAEDDEFGDLPGLLRAVEGVAIAVRGESRRALRGLIRVLARRSPAEAASFLLQEFSRQQQALAPLVQQTLPAFPSRQQAVLLERLSAYRRTGIMPPR